MRKDLPDAAKAIPEELVQLAVKTESGATYFAEVLRLGGRVAETRFRRDAMPTLAVGACARLAFRSPRFQKPVELVARVESRVESEASRGYGFNFEPAPDLEATLQVLYSLINQRHTHRVRPRMTESVQVVLGIPDADPSAARGRPQSAKAVLRDISLSGFAVRVPIELEARVARFERLSVSLHLPTSRSPLPLMAWIRNRRLDEKEVIYGLEFDREHSDHFEQHHQAVVAYVMQRQRDQLRVRSDRPALRSS